MVEELAIYLKGIIQNIGLSIIREYDRLENYLQIYSDKYRRDTNLIIISAKCGIPELIINSDGKYIDQRLFKSFANKLYSEYGIEQEIAADVVKLWIAVLGKKLKTGHKKLGSQFGDVFADRGNKLFQQGKFIDSIIWYDKAINIDSLSAYYYLCKANALRMLDRYDEAMVNYEKVTEIDGKFTDAYRAMGKMLNDMGRYEEALWNFNMAIKLEPQNFALYCEKGNALCRQGNYPEAIDCYDVAINTDADNALAYYSKAYALECAGKYEDAIECYEKSLQLKPDYTDAYYNRLILIRRLRDKN